MTSSSSRARASPTPPAASRPIDGLRGRRPERAGRKGAVHGTPRPAARLSRRGTRAGSSSSPSSCRRAIPPARPTPRTRASPRRRCSTSPATSCGSTCRTPGFAASIAASQKSMPDLIKSFSKSSSTLMKNWGDATDLTDQVFQRKADLYGLLYEIYDQLAVYGSGNIGITGDGNAAGFKGIASVGLSFRTSVISKAMNAKAVPLPRGAAPTIAHIRAEQAAAAELKPPNPNRLLGPAAMPARHRHHPHGARRASVDRRRTSVAGLQPRLTQHPAQGGSPGNAFQRSARPLRREHPADDSQARVLGAGHDVFRFKALGDRPLPRDPPGHRDERHRRELQRAGSPPARDLRRDPSRREWWNTSTASSRSPPAAARTAESLYKQLLPHGGERRPARRA